MEPQSESQPPQPVIEIDKVCFSYTQREILHNLNFQIESGSMTAIVGPNGGGKTTLLHLALGILQPDRGDVRLLGQTPHKTRHLVGYVPQKLDFDPRFPISVLDVVKMGLLSPQTTRLRDHNLKKLAIEALNQTETKHLAHRAFSKLSGGERQRVLISSALVSKPKLLILDEPTANVDPQSEHEIYQLFQSLNRDREITIVFVSHNLNVVSSHVSHVVCVNHTAAVHKIDDVRQSTFTELYGGELSLINHDNNCHINDPSHALNEPHESGCGCNHKPQQNELS